MTEDDVAQFVASAPTMTLPASILPILEQARGFSDIDPDAAWEQWQFLRRRIAERGAAASDVFAEPRMQLETELPIIRQIAMVQLKLKPEVVEHQIAHLRDFAMRYLQDVESAFDAKS